jgi:hypothetical protein
MADHDRANFDRRDRPWPVVVHPVRDHGAHEAVDSLSPEQLFELVRVLSARMWELTGRPFPAYARSEMPIRVQRRVYLHAVGEPLND